MTALSVLSLALVTMSIIWVVGADEITKAEDSLEERYLDLYDSMLKEQVQILHSQLRALVILRDRGELDSNHAMELGRSLLRTARYGDSGYYWADTYDGYNVVLLGRSIEGGYRWHAQDPDGVYYIQELHKAGLSPGGGFVNYRFPRPDQSEPIRKRSYALAFEPFQWVIGTGYYLEDIEKIIQSEYDEAKATVLRIQWQLFAVLAAVMVGLMGASGMMGRRISRPLEELRLTFERLAANEPTAGVQLEVRSNDDIGSLMESFNRFMSRYTVVVRHEQAYRVLTDKLSLLAELHDGETSAHTMRVGKISRIIARGLGMAEERCEAIGQAARLHDVGKLFLDPHLINKQGMISEEERQLLQRHTLLAARLLDDETFALERSIAEAHHERIDGSGYPRGLKGDAIPLEAQIVGAADVFDALRSPRSYKSGLDTARALEIMRTGDSRMPAGTFSPVLLAVLEGSMDRIDREVYGIPQTVRT